MRLRRVVTLAIALSAVIAGLLPLAAAPAAAAPGPNRIVHTDPAEGFGRPALPRRAAGEVTAANVPACSNSHDRAFQLIYARPSNVASRIDSVQSVLLADAAAAGQRIADSSANGTAVRPRFLCGITVVQTGRPAGDYGSNPLPQIVGDLQAQGFSRSDRKYVIWWDGNPHPIACGEGTFADDERPSPAENYNNIGPDYAFVYKQSEAGGEFCGWTTLLHEMGHTIGAVMKNAPNATNNWHCTDEHDIMCYADAPGVVTTVACPGSFAYFDCGQNDYFSPLPPAGSYLATHWNTYRSSWLEAVDGSSPPPPPAPPPPATAPETTINSGPSGTVSEETAIFTFFSSVAGSTFRCALDGGSAVGCASPATYTGLAAGSHTFSVAAVEPGGLQDPTPAQAAWTVAPTPGAPETTISSHPGAASRSTTATFAFASTTGGSSFTCTLDGTSGPCTSPATYTSVLEGTHSFRVAATSPGGVADPTPAAHDWRVDATAPTVAMTLPSSPFAFSTRVTLDWNGEDTGAIPLYRIRYRSAPPNAGFGSHVVWRQQAASSAAFTGAAGRTYCFSVQAVDDAGNSSAYTAERCTAIALDDRAASVTGFERRFGSAFYAGTVSVARLGGSRLIVGNIRARHLAVRVQMCSTCRYVDAYWNGRLLKRMSLTAANARIVTVGLTSFSTVQEGTLTFIVRTPSVVIDAISAPQA